MSRTLLLALISLVLLGSGELTDPTRPAPGLERLAGGTPKDSAKPTTPRVTSIVVSPGRRIAVIDGNRVTIGDRVGAARVEGISLSTVQLRGPAGAFALSLYATPVLKLSPGREAP